MGLDPNAEMQQGQWWAVYRICLQGILHLHILCPDSLLKGPKGTAIWMSSSQYKQKGHITQHGIMPPAQKQCLSLAQDGFVGRLDHAGPPHHCQAPESKLVLLKAGD